MHTWAGTIFRINLWLFCFSCLPFQIQPPLQLPPTTKFDAIVLAQYKHQIKVAHINELISYPKYYNGNWITLISTSPVAVMCNEFIWLFGWTAIIFMEISSWLSRVRKTYTHTHIHTHAICTHIEWRPSKEAAWVFVQKCKQTCTNSISLRQQW